MKAKKIKVAIIDNSLNPALYKPVEHWSVFLDVPWESFRAVKGTFPDLRDGCTHLILTGSEASIVEREGWVYEEVEVVREALRLGIPILGSCYGHHLLALALRGPSSVQRSRRPEVGWIPVEILRPSDLLGEKGTIQTFSSHFDEVICLDREFLILASTPSCSVQAFQFKKRPVWGIQFHPEIDIVRAKEFLEALARLGLPNSPLFAQALTTEPKDSGLIHRIVRQFIASREFARK